MSGKIISIVSTYLYNSNNTLKTINLNPDNTYLAVAGPGQENFERLLESSPEIKIIFKSRKAVNRTPNHGDEPRNTLYIFEVADEYADKIREERAKLEAERIPALKRFKECCAAYELNYQHGWSVKGACRTYIPEYKEYCDLINKYRFSFYEDYRYANDYVKPTKT